MIAFPDQRTAGTRAAPWLSVAVFLMLAALAGLSASGQLGAGAPLWWALATGAVLVLMTSTCLEFALGKAIYGLSLMLSALSAFGLNYVVLGDAAQGLSWLPEAAVVLSGISAGLFRAWWLRPLYFLPGPLGLIRFPAISPMLFGLVLLIVFRFGHDSSPLLVDLVCAVGGVVIGLAMNGLSLVEPGMISGEYLSRVLRKGLQESEELIRQHKLSKARRLIARLANLAPDDGAVRRARYAVWKYHPERPEFHAAAAALLDQPEGEAKADRLVASVYRDYMAVTQGKPQLPARLHLALARRFAQDRRLEDAANIVNVFLQRSIEHDGMPEALLCLANGYVQTERSSKAAHYAETLIALYPQSREANDAYQMLQRLEQSLG